MQKIADMVIPKESVADIGTDHGYIPAYLLDEGICTGAILTDIAAGPLQRAKSHFEEYGLNAEFRQGPGLEIIENGEVSSVIIAGMGGETITDILGKDIEKSHSFRRIIIQPRTYIGELRVWLSENGFRFTDYALCRENKRICEIMAVEPGYAEIKENPVFSEFLLSRKDPLTKEYIERMIRSKKSILKEIKKSKDNSELEKQFADEISFLNSIK